MAKEKFNMITSAARMDGVVLAVIAGDGSMLYAMAHVLYVPAYCGS